jgi:hypothetical protein
MRETAEEGCVSASNAVSLQRATPDMAPTLCDLLELYMHELSEIFPVALGPEGRFEYTKLPLYWSEPAVRQAFLIKHGVESARPGDPQGWGVFRFPSTARCTAL